MKLCIFEWSNFKNKFEAFDAFFIFSFMFGCMVMSFSYIVFSIVKFVSEFLFGEWSIFAVFVFLIWFVSFLKFVLKWSNGFVKRCFIEMEAIE